MAAPIVDMEAVTSMVFVLQLLLFKSAACQGGTSDVAFGTTGGQGINQFFPIGRMEPTTRPCNLESLARIPSRQYCDKYYVCSNGVYVGQFCPSGMAFDFGLQQCRLSREVDCAGRPDFFNPRPPSPVSSMQPFPIVTGPMTTQTGLPGPQTAGQNMMVLPFGAQVVIPVGTSIVLPPGSQVQPGPLGSGFMPVIPGPTLAIPMRAGVPGETPAMSMGSAVPEETSGQLGSTMMATGVPGQTPTMIMGSTVLEQTSGQVGSTMTETGTGVPGQTPAMTLGTDISSGQSLSMITGTSAETVPGTSTTDHHGGHHGAGQ